MRRPVTGDGRSKFYCHLYHWPRKNVGVLELGEPEASAGTQRSGRGTRLALVVLSVALAASLAAIAVLAYRVVDQSDRAYGDDGGC